MKSYSFFKNPKKLLYIMVLGLCMIFLTGNFWRERCIPFLTYPFLCIEKRCIAPIKQWLVWRKGVEHMHEIAQQLLQERNALLKMLIELKGTKEYLTDCGECREFQKRYAADSTFTAQILLQHTSEKGQYLFVDAGENRGIKKDMVVVYDACLLGKVTEVYKHFSKVMLITDKECHVAASCVETGARGIHSGMNATDSAALEFVSHLDTLKEGDLIISQGEGLIFPRGFGVGRIKKYELDGVQFRVKVEPLLDFSTLKFCLILKTY